MTEKPTSQTATELRDSGLRVTAARCAVLDWLRDHPHATVDEICDGTRERLGAVSKQAVYGVLSACGEAGLVRQIRPDGHPARFERRTGDNHHHLICRSCGRVEDADCKIGARPCLTPDRDHGFDVDEAEVMFWGLCSTCKVKPSNLSAGDEPRNPKKEDLL